MSGDLRRIEVIDDAMAEVLRRKTPAERLVIGFGLWRSARKLLRGQLASLHPDWDTAPNAQGLGIIDHSRGEWDDQGRGMGRGEDTVRAGGIRPVECTP